jgi:hypothetical protein
MYLSSYGSLSKQKLLEHWETHDRSGYANMAELLCSNGFTSEDWLPAFDAQSYTVYNNLQSSALNEVLAIAHFAEIGIPNLLAMSADHEFDPAFRCALFGDPATMSDVELYRQWVQSGPPRNEAPNEAQLLRSWDVQLSYIPDGFLWRRYLGDRTHVAVAIPHTKWHAFEHFVKYGVLDNAPLPLTEECATEVLLRIADRFVMLGQALDADRVYERAVLIGRDSQSLHQHAADNSLRLGQSALALRLYGHVKERDAATFWTYANAVDAARAIGEFDCALTWLEDGLRLFPRNQRLLTSHSELCGQLFDLAVSRHINALQYSEKSFSSSIQNDL